MTFSLTHPVSKQNQENTVESLILQNVHGQMMMICQKYTHYINHVVNKGDNQFNNENIQCTDGNTLNTLTSLSN